MIRYMRRHPLRGFLLGILALAALNLAVQVTWALYHVLPLLVLAAAAAYVLARRRVLPPRPPKVIQGRADDDGEVIRLRADVEALRAERDQAQESARAAWEQASKPEVQAPLTARDRLLSDRLSGVHDLFGRDDA